MREDAKDVLSCDTWGTVYSTAYNKTIKLYNVPHDTKLPYAEYQKTLFGQPVKYQIQKSM